MSAVKVLRCAIYTRKSTEHGLELEFNSLDAQREACAAYIKSQHAIGWRAIDTRYDDAAFSGGTIERPSLQALLKDVEGGSVDVIVVYKIDRLTRSLADFAKLVELFEAKNVSFVAVTQQFNTTTSMGRLTLNVLLSFAQFERELASERVRDKIAAARRKGKWTGGTVPLGYDAINKKLVVNKAEAERLRKIYGRYLALGSLEKVLAELSRDGVVTKNRKLAKRNVGGQAFTYGTLSYLLKNRTYLGETCHGGQWFTGEHTPIIEADVFDRVQDMLKSHSVVRTGRRCSSGSPLRGLVFDDAGNRMSPSFTTKKGVRYRFYVSAPALRGQNKPIGSRSRISAPLLEGYVQAALLENRSFAAATDIVDIVTSIVVGKRSVRIELRDTDRPLQIELSDRNSSAAVSETGDRLTKSPNQQLIAALVRAQSWLKSLESRQYESVEALATEAKINPKVIRTRIALAFLPPKTKRAILCGETHEVTIKQLCSVGLGWTAH